jgi:thiol-disulfide isomerase/thioredoxin
MKQILFTLFLAASACTVFAQPETVAADAVRTDAEAPKPYQVGDVAEDFELKNVDSRMVSLRAEFGDKVEGYVVIFTCNHCPFAKMYEDRFIEFHKKYSELGWPVVAINPNNPEIAPDDSFDAMIERANSIFSF